MRPQVRPTPLEVRADPLPEIAPAGQPSSEEQEMFGVRVNWQSEAVRIEAAEFMVATRVQEDSRRRLAGRLLRLREQRTRRARGG